MTHPQNNARSLLLLSAALLLLAAAGAWLTPNHAAHASEDAAAVRSQYSQKVSEHYDAHLGDHSPFLPSNATTDTGEFLDPSTFQTAAYCGHCHQESHKEWRQSAHANSFRAPWYRTNVNLLMQTKGNEFARHCEGCHNPIALLSGSITKGVKQERPTDNDGVTCTVCHSIQKVDQRGTGSYVMGQSAVLVDEQDKPIYGKVSDAEILAHLDRHSKAVMRPFYKTAEFCTACHKAALPETLNGYKWQRAIFLSDEWQMSSFAKQSPLPFYVKPAVSTCQTCHMGPETLSKPDPGAKDGKLASHRWLGANTLLPTFYNYDEQLAKTTAFLKNNVFNIDLFSLETGHNPPVRPLGTQAYDLKPGDLATVSVIIQNKGIAHSHVPEQRDMYESWVRFSVKDDAGHELLSSGFLNSDGTLDKGAHSFTNRLINKDGQLNQHHEVWTNRIVAYNNTIQSGRSQLVRYQFKVPAQMTASTLTVTASVEYHRFNQTFIDWANKKHTEQPQVTMASRTRLLKIGRNEVEPADPADNPVWMRWNNFGIALLDAQQYPESVQAFEQVVRLRPDYADAYTNVGLADFQWQRYAEARVSFDKALTLSPGNARALYYMALVERNSGHIEAEVSDLKQVVAQFPRSRDARRELGFSYYQQHQYDLARVEYEQLQSIDPDDLAAHYNLAIIYRRLGMKTEAARESAAFADQKDDPSANTVALEYLRKHDDIATESTPYHLHGDLETQGKPQDDPHAALPAPMPGGGPH